MTQFIALVALLACFVPALMALMFASRRWYFVLWNFSWFWIMGVLGQAATGSPLGSVVGVFFAVAYVARLLRRTDYPEARFTSRGFVFRGGAQPNPFGAPPAPDVPPPAPPSAARDVVIDAEFTRSPGDASSLK